MTVIRDRRRPPVPDLSACTQSEGTSLEEYKELMCSSWDHDPTVRPTFLELMTRLGSMTGEGVLSSIGSSSSSSYQSSYLHSMSSTHSGSTKSDSAGSASSAHGAVHAPEGEVTIVFTDIIRAASLWEFNPDAMRDATILHNELLRSILKKYGGYEVVFLRCELTTRVSERAWRHSS